MFSGLRAPELLLILLVVVLLFGAKKLPDTARGLGRAMRILKTETKGLRDDDDNESDVSSGHVQPAPPRQIPAAPVDATQPAQPVSRPEHTER